MLAVVACDSYFVQREEAMRRKRLAGHQKRTAALHVMPQSVFGHAIDGTLAISESTEMEASRHFCETAVF